MALEYGRVIELLETQLCARPIAIGTFPARRHDERGWHIGHVVQGVTLTDQVTFISANTEVETEARIRSFVDKLATIGHGDILSARPGSVADASYVTVNGLIVRLVSMPDGLRADVVVGAMVSVPSAVELRHVSVKG